MIRLQTHSSELWELLAKWSYVNSITVNVHFNVNVVFRLGTEQHSLRSVIIYKICVLKTLAYFTAQLLGLVGRWLGQSDPNWVDNGQSGMRDVDLKKNSHDALRFIFCNFPLHLSRQSLK